MFLPAGARADQRISEGKAKLDDKLPEGMPGFLAHALRRTARSLMSRPGRSSDHAERVMGHAIAGVEGIYDRHAYRDEKADALAKLAALIELIVDPGRANVVAMTNPKRRQLAVNRLYAGLRS